MKHKFLIPTMVFILASFLSNAQTKTKKDRPAVTKGYYSIGNHSEKLSTPVSLKVLPSSGQSPVQKGYYSMESNRKKLPASYDIAVPKSRIKVTKGYYGIGDHNEKLK